MSDGREKLLEVKNLTVAYGDLEAIRDINLEVHRGDMVSIIGANGAGKSTLLNTIMGIQKPKEGQVIWLGEDVTGKPTNKIASKRLAMSPEGSHVFEDMTVRENLLLGAYPKHAKAHREENMEKVFHTFPILKQKYGQLATYLSGGQRQMLAIARTIMAEPELIICDEISLGLAPVIIKDIYAALHEINETGMSFLIVEQEIKRSLKNSDYAYVMVTGNMVMEGKSSELSEAAISDLYFGVDSKTESQPEEQ